MFYIDFVVQQRVGDPWQLTVTFFVMRYNAHNIIRISLPAFKEPMNDLSIKNADVYFKQLPTQHVYVLTN